MRVDAVAFDVNETLSDLGGLRRRFTEVGAPPHLLDTWLAATLRDGFALATVGEYAEFRVLGRGNLLAWMPPQAADSVLAGFTELDVHPDVGPGMRRLAEAGVRLVTLTNGNAGLTERLLERAGLRDLVERCLSVDEVRRWKPGPEPYRHAAATLGLMPERVALVAVLPWDVHGARRAGMVGGYLNRGRTPWPEAFAAPDIEAPDLVGLADRLIAG